MHLLLLCCFNLKKSAGEAKIMLTEPYSDDDIPTDKLHRERFRRFRSGDFSVKNDHEPPPPMSLAQGFWKIRWNCTQLLMKIRFHTSQARIITICNTINSSMRKSYGNNLIAGQSCVPYIAHFLIITFLRPKNGPNSFEGPNLIKIL